MRIEYDIKDFKWHKDLNILEAREEDLYEVTREYLLPFPNDRKHFFILNGKTNQFRRFRWCRDYDNVSVFSSVGKIYCIVIRKEVNHNLYRHLCRVIG
jgi:hypothetical protein